ncbi:MAG: phage tail tape measure protein, partial [Nitrospiraceae bacterium]
SQQIGVSVESLSALRYAAELSELSAEQLTQGLKFLAKNAVEAASGGSDAVVAFGDVGVSVKDAHGKIKPVEELLLDVADAFHRSDDNAAKTALAVKLFGRAGIELIPFLNEGRVGIERMMQEAQRLGLVMSKETAKASDEFNDNLTRLERTLTGIKIKIGVELIPVLNKAAEGFLKLIDRTTTWREKLEILSKTFIAMPSPLLKMMGVIGAAATGGAGTMFGPGGEKLPGGGSPTGPEPSGPKGSLSVTSLDKKATQHYLNWINALDKMNKEMRESGAKRDAALRESEAANIIGNLPENRPAGATTDRMQHFPTTPTIRKFLEDENEQRTNLLKQSASLELQNDKALADANDELNERKRKANQGFFDSYKEGMREYVGGTGQMFTLATDMARTTATAMASAFQSFFFDLFEGRMKSLKDVLNGVLGFVKQIASEVAARIATTAVLRGIGFAHEGGAIQRFAFGGPVFSNNDSVPAMLTPGEFVVSRRGVDALNRLNQGQVGGGGIGNLTVNVVGTGRTDKPDVNVRQELRGLVLDIIFRDVAANGSMRQLLKSGA